MAAIAPRKRHLSRRLFLTAATSMALAAATIAQPPSAAQTVTTDVAPITVPAFDVISIKPNKASNGTRMQFTPDGFHSTGVTAHFLLFEGFGVNPLVYKGR